ncbi:DNA replication/repair protein RecF [Altererythrobacter aquiaggeris]|uniref:DNA replication/repair protein RecF n=1 Tax=Aestuarierythrobacter aquiaggeris TaxID=1898396 RepID=UPI0030158E26
MALDRLDISDFRNHRASRVEDTRQFNLLVGENGAGKTNVLEALSLFAPGRGLRRVPLADMASVGGSGGFALGAALTPHDGGTPLRLGTAMQAERPGRRLVQINGAEASATRLGEWLAMGWLTPAMDGLFSDSAGARRRFLDRMALAIDPGHARLASRYENALRERNRMLGGDVMPEAIWFDAVEAQLAQAGAALTQGRTALVDQLSAELAGIPPEPFALPRLTYLPAGPADADSFARVLRDDRARDRAARRTLTGPHRAELEVRMAGRGVAAAQCSTGEQKAMLIAITLAHSDLAARGRPNLLLLDEVAAHLDPVRRTALFGRLRASGAQVWLTGTELAPFTDIESEAAIWRVDGGAVQRL